MKYYVNKVFAFLSAKIPNILIGCQLAFQNDGMQIELQYDFRQNVFAN
jgi:hypothetical protein